MKDSNAERMLRKYKGFANSVKQMLNQEYKFLGGDKIQDMFIKDLLEEFNRHLKDGWKLDAGQVVWWAAHKDEYPGRSQTAAAHPAASRRGMRGAAAWRRHYIDLIHS